MKMIENLDLLAHKRRVEAQRRADAIARRKQNVLHAITPGTATPASVAPFIRKVA